jgi:DNA primase
MDSLDLINVSPPRTVNPIRRDLMEMAYGSVPISVLETLYDRYHIAPTLTARGDFKWSGPKRRLIMPIMRPNRVPVGFVARSLEGAKPKTLTFIHSPEQPIAAYYMNPNSKVMWIVEDQLSGLRISDYANACSLLGTHLNEGVAHDIKKTGVTHLVWCLDRDAKSKAAEQMKQYSGLAPAMSLRIPTKDPKDMTNAELRELIEGV